MTAPTPLSPSRALVAQIAADVIRDAVLSNRQDLTDRVTAEVTDRGLDASDITEGEVSAAARASLSQDALTQSKRVWAVAAPVVTALIYALLSPETLAAFFRWLEAHPSGWGWVAAQVISLVLVALSKRNDARPMQ